MTGRPSARGTISKGAPTVGDIRIGGFTQGSNVLAFTLLPPGANGGSDAGDILLNTNQSWHNNSDYDLETVLIHEIGHALGLGHSTDINAAMYPYYGGVEQSPNTDDVAGVQTIWGPRQEDPFVQQNGNLSAAKAVDVTSFLNTTINQVALPGLDVAKSSESYWYKVTTPANASSTLTAQVQSAGLSELSPRVQIYSSTIRGLAQVSAAPNAYGATTSVSINGVTPNTVYYVSVLGSNSGATGTGGYQLTINMGSGSIASATLPNTTIPTQPDQGGGAILELTGALGGWLKEWARSDGNTPIATIGIQADVGLTTVLNAIAAKMASTTAPSAEAFDDALMGLLQAVPDDILGDNTTELLQLVQAKFPGADPMTKLDSLLTKFFATLLIDLNKATAKG